jgi:uncharacterized protein (TIGR02145 family)
MKTKARFLSYSLFITGVLLFFIIGCKKDQTENNTDQIERGTMTDIDGNVYVTVKIGTQWWMAENLKVTRYRNGDSVTAVSDSTEWCKLTSGASCYYQDDPDYLLKYGRLYNWYAVSDNRNIAPEGWHIPAETDWWTLRNYLGGIDSDAGKKLKDKNSWEIFLIDVLGTNSTGFTALAAGYRSYKSGGYEDMGYVTFFWSIKGGNNSSASCWDLSYSGSWLSESNFNKRTGLSVRCVKD